MFVDEAKISVKAGNGGGGCASFETTRGKKYGRPNGGIGGQGGNIVILADNNRQTLIEFRFNKHFKATSGKHGGSNNKKGEDGKECLLRVPPGTIIRDSDTGAILRDLSKTGEQVIIARGGAGGRGNSRKREATPGEAGESRELSLELKLVADVGIIGYPNAGKSTLLSKITSARPRIAGFPFTTKNPNLGVAQLGDFSFVIADIPGLIEGAHSGRGLGDRFLRHIERTRILVHLIDMSGIEGRDPEVSFSKLNMELGLYSKELTLKKQVIVANKMDMPQSKETIKFFDPKGVGKVYRISAMTGEGISDFLKGLAAELKKVI
ncbi:MAG: Obg family GTPase CgtA [Candidatus Omnitrophica bacterium]|nr:Obg family GTPase CgtA [Candidatus Omnitrophota bacterium]